MIKVELWIEGDEHNGKRRFRRIRLVGVPHAGDYLALNIGAGDDRRGVHVRVDRVVLADRPTSTYPTTSGESTDDVVAWGTLVDPEQAGRLFAS